ncbi:MAG: NAD(P)/FAD-dependent oxidoreductase [Acidimicrobiia bacterium]|nr:MAG: NAD(P)/FAD-dependent oxidoreductase [Acidimicrobiia bacterium]
MAEQVDVVVLGLGTGGEDLALRLADAGLDVVGIEGSLLGGECAYWACIPSKMMIRAANLLQEARRVDGMAGHAEVTPDWAPVAARIRAEATGDWDDTIAVGRLEDSGGRFIRGRGRLVGPRTVAVGDETFTATRGIVIATGSRPFIPPIPGLADVDYWTTHDAIAVERLPDSLTILGGGAVGCELGQVFSRFGVDVSIVEGRDRLLGLEEPEASTVIESVFEAEGISLHLGSRAERIEAGGETVMVVLDDGTQITADRLLVATGRFVDLSDLGLETAGLDPAAPFIEVDDRLRAADGIWAMGDVTGKAMFTHVAVYQASIVAAEVLGLEHAPADYSALPRLTFTDPEIGSVGMTEDQAREAGIDVVVTVKQVPATFRGWLHGPGNEGIIKLIADRNAGILVGATSMGPRGGEVLAMLSTAIHASVPLATLQNMIYAYPTFYGGVGETLGAYGRGIGKVIDPDATPEVFDFVGER